MPKLTVKQWQEKLFEELDLSGLESWPPDLAAAAQSLLAEYHDVFSLEPNELGCTNSTTHVIKVTSDTPFKEWFRWKPPSLVEEVNMHLQEMLNSGTIHPSQSAWYNTVVLAWKKDWVQPHAFWTVQCPSYFPVADAKLPRRIESDLLPHLSGWHSHLLTYCRRTPSPFTCCFWLI